MSKNTTSLVCTPAPLPQESLHGYLLRVSEANGYPDPRWIMQHANLSEKQIRLVRPPLAPLAKALACSKSDLIDMSFGAHTDQVQRNSGFTINGHDVVKLDLAIKQTRICPDCILETGKIDLSWSLRTSIACPTHRRLALQKCPSCNKHLSVMRKGLLICSCGYDLTQATREETASEVALALLKAINNKLYGLPVSDNQVDAFGFPIDLFESLSLRSFLSLIERIRLRVPSTTNRNRRSSTISIQSLHEVGDALSNWPTGFYQFIESTGKTKDIQANSSLTRQFYTFYQCFVKDPNLPQDVSSFFKETLVSFGEDYWKKGMMGRYNGLSSNDRKIVGINGLAEHLNVQKDTAIKLVELGIIEPVASADDHAKRPLFDISQEMPRRISEGKSLGEREAAFTLGIPVSVLKMLRQMNVIKFKHIGATLASFHEFDINEFNERMTSKIKLLKSEHSSKKHFTLEKAMRTKTGNIEHKGDLIAAIIEGGVQTYGRLGGNAGSVILCESEITDYFRHKMMLDSNAVLVSEAAKLLHCDPEAIRSLADQGILLGRQDEQCFRIYEDSLHEFNESYISTAELASTLKTSSKAILEICKAYNTDILYAERLRKKPRQPFISKQKLSIFGL